MRRLRQFVKFETTLVGLVTLLGLSACSGPETTPEVQIEKAVETEKPFKTASWPMARGGPQLQGATVDPVPVSPQILWSYQADSGISADAAIDQNVIFFGTDGGILHAIDALTGNDIWQHQSSDVIESEPTVGLGSVFFGCNDGLFLALDLESGMEKWRYQMEDKVTAGATLVTAPHSQEPWILINGYDGYCHCLNAETGNVLWKYKTESFINGSPAIVNDKYIVFGGCDSLLHTLDLETGKPLHTIPSDAYIPASLATFGNFGYCGNYANEVLAFDIENESILWVYDDRSFPFFSAPAVDETHVFIGSRDKNLHAIDRQSGQREWKHKLSSKVDSSPIVFSDAVVCNSQDGRLYALSLNDGTELWQLDLGTNILASPAYASGRIILGGSDGTLFAIGEEILNPN